MSRLLLPLFSLSALFALSGCLPEKDAPSTDDGEDTGPIDNPDDTDADTDADSDTDTDSDTDADTDTDTDADTDSDTDTDTDPREDNDRDGYTVREGDCDDDDSEINPGADEICDEIDNDCDRDIDEDPVDGDEYPSDNDGDGFGDLTHTVVACEPVVENTFDCDDDDATEPVVVDQYNGSASGRGTLDDPFETIQDGIDASDLCVAVYPGNYQETIDFGGKDLEVFSTSGVKNTIIDGNGGGSVVTFDSGESPAAELRGFTITAGTGTIETSSSSSSCGSAETCVTNYTRFYGGGIFVDGANPTLRNLLVMGNTLAEYSYTEVDENTDAYVYSYGGGVFINNSRGMTLIDVGFAVNYADQGGALYVGDSAEVAVTQSRVSYNSAAGGAGFNVGGGALTVTNVIFSGNAASTGGGASYVDDGTLTWWNVSAAGNAGTSGSGVAVMGASDFQFYSSVIALNNGGAGVYLESSSSHLDAQYSNAYSNDGGNYTGVTAPTGSSGNVEVDPGFVDFTDDGTENDDFT
ncbi:MAG: MopE-related protein, partial [Myxococcota bacterium]